MQLLPPRQEQLAALIRQLGLPEIAPVDWSLLELALTHPTFSQPANYQQLEFVGDSVVRLAAAEVLLETYPHASVGEFAKLRSGMVSDRTLAEFAERYALDSYLLLSPGAASDAKGRGKRLADAFEAVLGALYLSTHTLELVRPWLDVLLLEKAREMLQDPARQNYKDALQEWTQAQYRQLPEYRVWEQEAATGAGRTFIAEVWFNDQQLGSGSGLTKKAAEQAAARSSLEIIQVNLA
jgi:ribonuclease-3